MTSVAAAPSSPAVHSDPYRRKTAVTAPTDFSLDAMAAAAVVAGVALAPPGHPLIPASGDHAKTTPVMADPAPPAAQVDPAASAHLTAEKQLAQARAVERPNQVDLAQRAADELSSPRDPLRLIPTPSTATAQAAATPGPPREASSNAIGNDAAQRASADGETRPAEPAESPIASRPEAGPRSLTTSTTAPAASSSVAANAGHVHGAIAGPAQPRANTASASAATGAAVSGVNGSSKSTGPAAASQPVAGPATAGRDRLWRHLEQLGQRPAATHSGKETQADELDAQPARLHAQVARGLAAALKQGDGEVTLRLTPETLGKLRIDIAIADERVTARIAASSEQACRLLKESVVSLRTALEATGLGVDRIEVVGAPAEPATQPASTSSSPAGAAHPSMSSMSWGGHSGEPGGRHADGRDPGRSGRPGSPRVAAAGAPDQEAAAGDGEYVLRIDFVA